MNKEQIDELDKRILDIDIENVIKYKLYVLIEEQKDDIDEYDIMRILIEDNSIIEYLYLYLRYTTLLSLFDKQYIIVKLEINSTGEYFAYLIDNAKRKID